MDKPALAQQLDLEPHPEGGWYRQTWRAPVEFRPDGYPGPRAAATAIYFLLTPGEVSQWHVVRSDELWLWQSGGPLVLTIAPTPGAADARDVVLGPGHEFQGLVPAGQWQTARPAGDEPVLVSCIVAPGFEYEDWKLHTPRAGSTSEHGGGARPLAGRLRRRTRRRPASTGTGAGTRTR